MTETNPLSVLRFGLAGEGFYQNRYVGIVPNTHMHLMVEENDYWLYHQYAPKSAIRSGEAPKYKIIYGYKSGGPAEYITYADDVLSITCIVKDILRRYGHEPNTTEG